jgi:Ca2+-binding RTX toxin-like protein
MSGAVAPPAATVITGADGYSDGLTGTAGADRILGLSGNDALDGSAGDDVLEGGLGDDALFGGTGNDRLWGDNENETLLGGQYHGSDYLDGGSKGHNSVLNIARQRSNIPACLLRKLNKSNNQGLARAYN